jgi:hypothetical protein
MSLVGGSVVNVNTSCLFWINNDQLPVAMPLYLIYWVVRLASNLIEGNHWATGRKYLVQIQSHVKKETLCIAIDSMWSRGDTKGLKMIYPQRSFSSVRCSNQVRVIYGAPRSSFMPIHQNVSSVEYWWGYYKPKVCPSAVFKPEWGRPQWRYKEHLLGPDSLRYMSLIDCKELVDGPPQ